MSRPHTVFMFLGVLSQEFILSRLQTPYAGTGSQGGFGGGLPLLECDIVFSLSSIPRPWFPRYLNCLSRLSR